MHMGLDTIHLTIPAANGSLLCAGTCKPRAELHCSLHMGRTAEAKVTVVSQHRDTFTTGKEARALYRKKQQSVEMVCACMHGGCAHVCVY